MVEVFHMVDTVVVRHERFSTNRCVTAAGSAATNFSRFSSELASMRRPSWVTVGPS
jgi:hypothetical protein